MNEVEARSLKISGLEDDGELSIYSATVLRDSNAKRAKGNMSTLAYLFRFLDAYNFSSEGGEQIQEENKSLINASVLGLIFEKINGYKDGSFFTPGFITMYMSEETIRRAILQKYKEQTDFDSEDWADLKNYIGRPYKKEDLQRHNAIIDDLKICDPAVGSGHFLVSALNEIIAIKSDLGILCDRHYEKLPVEASVDNDELIIINDDREHELFEYDYRSKVSQQVQEALFYQKQQIIENCLFGVDINPNSVKICRLRLWIELLKNAYYTPASDYTDLETLPNIDINIKCGNSLISRFGLDSDLKPALKKSKFTIDGYKSAVASYKHASDKEEKRAFKELIATIKDDFRSTVSSKEKIDLQKLEGQFFDRFGGNVLIDVELTKAQKAKKDKEQKKLMDRIQKKKAEIEEIQNNVIYHNAFEWRFEFPEVLDDEGKYVGFDVVIGNPPYIRQEEFSDIKKYLDKNYTCYRGTADMYVYFVERGMSVMKSQGQFVYIIPNKWMRAGYGSELRKYISDHRLYGLFDFGDLPVFEEATTYPCIISMQKDGSEDIFYAAEINTLDYEDGLPNYIQQHQFEIALSRLNPEGWTLTSVAHQELLDRLRAKGTPLGEYVNNKIYYGIKTGYNEAFVIDEETKSRLIAEHTSSAEIIKPFLAGRDIKRYQTPVAEKYLILFKNGWTREQFGKLTEDQAWDKLREMYPAICDWLLSFEEKAKKRTDQGEYWWELRACAYYDEFEREKIVWPETSMDMQFCFISGGIYLNKTTFMISEFEKCLLGLLNSKLTLYQLDAAVTKVRGGYFSMSKVFVEKIGILEFKDSNTIDSLISEITSLKKQDSNADTSVLEAEIDRLVYELYELTAEEIALVEEAVG